MTGVIFNHAVRLRNGGRAGRRYVANEFAEVPDLVAAALLSAGDARRADGTKVEEVMTDGNGHSIRAFGASVPRPVAVLTARRR
jgi:hypothetical protein